MSVNAPGETGTGKTTTLKALLNALHQREYNRYYDKLLNLARVSPEETPAAWEKLSECSSSLLWCGNTSEYSSLLWCEKLSEYSSLLTVV